MKTSLRGWVCAVGVLILSFSAAFLSGCAGLVSTANTTPPPPSTLDITNVQTGSITTSSSQVVWTTNVPANSSVDYGTTTAYGNSTLVDSTMVTSHQVTLSGLAAGTTYFYQVNSTDSKNNHGKSGGHTLNTTGFNIVGTISPATGGNGATVTLSGAASATATADSLGNYTFAGLPNGKYTVAPSHAGYTFTPSSQSTTINGANVTGVNFTDTAQTFSISGTISPAANGSGATVTLSGAAGASTTANSFGNYSFAGLANGSYTVTPNKAGFTFTPGSANATVNGANVTAINFTAATQTNPTFSISGTISPTAGGSGATLTLSGAASATATSDSSGNYTFSGLANGSYTVAPSNTGYTFAPLSQAVTVSSANVTGVNFTAQVAVQPAAGAPVLFFSDLNSGPATGNSDSTYTTNGGVYVKIYGNFFGSSQGTSTITLNGANCLHVINWGSVWLWYQEITVQLTSGCSTGNFVVTTTSGTSNGLAFTVRSGGIFYVSASGSNNNTGTFASPWATMSHAAQTVGTTAGNTIYVENGVVNSADDGQGWGGAVTLRQEWCKGTQAAPNTISAYPGATATLGGSAPSAISSTDETASPGACGGGWTFSGLLLRGSTLGEIRGPSNYWRFVGMDMSTGAGAGWAAGSFEPLQAQNVKLLGNYMHQLNTTSTNRLSQGLYLSTDSDHDEVAWNEIAFCGGRSCFQVHSSPLCIPGCGSSDTTGFIMFDEQIHDNTIHDSREECMVIDTMDPSQGAVLVYNNVLYNCGQDGSADGDMYHPMSSDYNENASTGVNGTGKGGTGSGTVQVYNNTIYCQAGTACWTSNFEVHTNQNYIYKVRNNLLYSTGKVGYWSPGLSSSVAQGGQCSLTDTTSSCPNFSGSNDLVFGDGALTFTNILTSLLNLDPLVTNAAADDFHLTIGSPASGAGVAIPGLLYDHDGKPRKNPPSIGAYE